MESGARGQEGAAVMGEGSRTGWGLVWDLGPFQPTTGLGDVAISN